MRITAALLLIIWLVLVIIGKSGFVHVLLLIGIAFAVIDILVVYRSRVTDK